MMDDNDIKIIYRAGVVVGVVFILFIVLNFGLVGSAIYCDSHDACESDNTSWICESMCENGALSDKEIHYHCETCVGEDMSNYTCGDSDEG